MLGHLLALVGAAAFAGAAAYFDHRDKIPLWAPSFWGGIGALCTFIWNLFVLDINAVVEPQHILKLVAVQILAYSLVRIFLSGGGGGGKRQRKLLAACSFWRKAV